MMSWDFLFQVHGCVNAHYECAFFLFGSGWGVRVIRRSTLYVSGISAQ